MQTHRYICRAPPELDPWLGLDVEHAVDGYEAAPDERPGDVQVGHDPADLAEVRSQDRAQRQGREEEEDSRDDGEGQEDAVELVSPN